MTRKRKAIWLVIATAIFAVIVGPWPNDHTPYLQAGYAQDSLERIRNAQPIVSAGALSAGYATADISPPVGVPLGGYSAREPKSNAGVLTPPHVSALTLANSQQTLTVVTADFLLPLPDYVAAVAQKTGLPRETLYFSATHTHSGPGGYQKGFIAEVSLGDFDPAYFSHLVNRTAEAVLASRQKLVPAELEYLRLRLTPEQSEHMLYNQLEGGPHGYPILHLLQVQALDKSPIVNLLGFGAHPTFLGRENKMVHGDYPILLQQKLQELLGQPVMFVVGPVGGTLPKALGEIPKAQVSDELRQLETFTLELSELVTTTLNHAQGKPVKNPQWLAKIDQRWITREAELGGLLSPIDLASGGFRVSDDWRLSPVVVNTLFHGSETFLHTLRIGRLAFVGFPADTSGELATSLEQWASTQGIDPWVTSFNGDYIGYISPEVRFTLPHYTVREMNLYGPWTGDYLVEASKEMIKRLWR